jgi:Na+/proline symporter
VGISLLASAFAADTPLWIGDIIYKRGIEGTWLYWANGIGAAFFILLIAPLWKRSGLMTEVELFEFRFAGKAAAFLRVFNGLYMSVFVTIIMMAVGTLSIAKIMQMTAGIDKTVSVVITVGVSLVYCAVSGLWGVCATDFMQFFVTMFGSFALAFFSLKAAGGASHVVEQVNSMTGWAGHELNVFPHISSSTGLPLATIIFLFGLKWFEYTGMGGFVAQRLFASKSVRQSVFTAMIGYGMYFSLIPLPWIITVICSKVHLPGIVDGQEAYPRMLMSVLPSGIKGIVIASLLAAFMSTYSTLLNTGSSYFMNDVYRRILFKNASEKHYVRVGQLYMIPMAIVSALIALYSDSILNLLFIPLAASAGGTLILLARWIWWRINAWTMIAATVGSPIVFASVYFFFPEWVDPDTMELYYGQRMMYIIAWTTVLCVIVTLVTKPVEAGVLDAFYRKVRPPGFWKPVRERLGMECEYTLGGFLFGWGILLAAIFGPLVGLIKLVFGDPIQGLALILLGVVGFILAVKRARKLYLD